MKRITIAALLMSLVYLPVLGQINMKHNWFRADDKIVKQQVEFKEPGDAGRNIVWDFSDLKPLNDAYTLDYAQAPTLGDTAYIMSGQVFDKRRVNGHNLIVGTEHHTMYYYRLKGDSLLLIGHENPTNQLTYSQPILLMKYPFNYGQKLRSEYSSQGYYSASNPLKTHGTVETSIDAFGKMILPNGDTLNPVLRMKTIQTIVNDISSTTAETLTQLETHRWYLKGYRYPVFETVKGINQNENNTIFSTAFYFPPQEHLYLETDPDNLALIEELWDFEKKKESRSTIPKTDDDILAADKPYSIYPNPVDKNLNLKYELQQSADLHISIYSQDGKLVKTIGKKSQQSGTHLELIDCSGMTSGAYLLHIKLGAKTINEKIIKK